MNKICVFCGSSPGAKPEYARAAKELGATIARMGIEVIYGASDLGLMGIMAQGALDEGGKVIGIMPKVFDGKVDHPDLTELIIVDTMHERKAKMFEMSDAFIALPGGLGTFEEILEIVTWAQIGIHTKPCGLLNISGFYDDLLKFLESAVEDRFIWKDHKNMLLFDSSAENLLKKFSNYKAPKIEKWRDRR